MLTAIIILQCTMLLILFGIYGNISKKEEHKESLPNNDSFERYSDGLEQTWIAINISLYKMYNDLDILDFDTLHAKLKNTIEELSKDPNQMKEWKAKLIEHMNETSNGEKENLL